MGNGIIENAMGGGNADPIATGMNMSPEEAEGYAAQQAAPMLPDFLTENHIVDTSHLWITHTVPDNAKICVASDGANFYAPPNADWNAVHAAGQVGGWSLGAGNAAVGHFGTYDFQRQANNNLFIKPYTNASNFAVGVYLHGAGFSLPHSIEIANAFARLKSSNAGDPDQLNWWARGWNAAAAQNLDLICN